MRVRDCMTRDVERASPTMPLSTVAQKMRDGDFGAMPVEENDRLIGMITDRDIAIRAVAEGRDPKNTAVKEVLTRHIQYCYEDQSVGEVAQLMGKNRIRRLPVLNREKRLVGILSIGDLALTESDREKVEDALCQISKHVHDAPPVHA